MNLSYLTVFKETLAWDVVTYPFHYASFLVQIGYRPKDPAEVSNNVLRKSLCFSSVTNTVGHIYMTDGLIGCFNGLSPFLCSHFVSKAVIRLYYDKCPPYEEWKRTKSISYSTVNLSSSKSGNDSHDSNGVEWKPICLQAALDCISRLAAITVSHPFTIVSCRMMAQFVGKEEKYISVSGSLYTIYREQGISGFFVGLVPQLIRQIISAVSLSVLLYILKNYTGCSQSLQENSYNIAEIAINNLTYPLHIVSVFTAANDYNLRAVSPPLMPDFDGDWVECWRYMSRTGQLKRAWFPFQRYSHRMSAKSIVLNVDDLD